MSDFSAARKNMVDCQIHTSGVVNARVLNAFAQTPREVFLPKALEKVAYADDTVLLEKEGFLMSPALHARMLEAAQPRPDDVALDIGGGTGYAPSILSHLVTTVIAIEENQSLFDTALKNWNALGLTNIAGFTGRLAEGSPKHAPFDFIFINGAVASVPDKIKKQLSQGGRLYTIIKKPGEIVGHMTCIQNMGGEVFSSHALFDASCPYLPGFAPQGQFQF